MSESTVPSKQIHSNSYSRQYSELKAKQGSLSRTDLLTDTTEQRAVERMFENAIQACSDLAQHIATHDFDFDGDTSKEAIRVLGREAVIDEETMNTSLRPSDSGTYWLTNTGG